MQMTHLGFGTVFSRLSKDSPEIVPSLLVKRPVTALIPVYGGSDMDLMNDEYLRFRRGPYTAEGLERRLTDGLIQNAYPFVGHPLVDLIRPGQNRADFLRDRGLNPDAPTVALLPGSRKNEVERIVQCGFNGWPRPCRREHLRQRFIDRQHRGPVSRNRRSSSMPQSVRKLSG